MGISWRASKELHLSEISGFFIEADRNGWLFFDNLFQESEAEAEHQASESHLWSMSCDNWSSQNHFIDGKTSAKRVKIAHSSSYDD